ncbi:MAG: class I SAM-dependent methyltransferase [Sedimenticola sp.]
MTDEKQTNTEEWDHTSHDQFVEDYANKSLNEQTLRRFQRFYEIANKLLGIEKKNLQLDIADIGCGAGTQASIWAEKGHQVYGIDINQPLVELAKERAKEKSLNIQYEVGSATNLPWPDRSVDVCLAPELLEHVEEWEQVLNEFIRVIRPGGILILSTNNKLCPIQQEFNLPLYSWYPGILKRYYEKLAKTTRPEIANYATYPAVNWFSFFSLQKYLKRKGFDCFDRFDVIEIKNKTKLEQIAMKAIRTISILRWFSHVGTPYTLLVAIKK